MNDMECSAKQKALDGILAYASGRGAEGLKAKYRPNPSAPETPADEVVAGVTTPGEELGEAPVPGDMPVDAAAPEGGEEDVAALLEQLDPETLKALLSGGGAGQ